MRKLSKILAAVLLVATLVSVLAVAGVFSAFAEAAAEEQTYGTVVWDMDVNSFSYNTDAYGTTSDPHVEKDSTTGYIKYYYPSDAAYATAGNSGDFWQISGLSNGGVYINNKYTGTLDTAEDGTVTDNRTITKHKNTDYLVIDFDLGSENGALLEGFYFHNRWYGQSGSSGTGNASVGGASQQNYIMFNGTDTSSFYISQYQSAGLNIHPVKTPGEWINVTLIYDFSSVDEYGYAIPDNWRAWAYIDGVLCGQIGVPAAHAVSYYFNRISTVGGVQEGPGVATLFDNFTYKRFDAGYDGPLAQPGILGSTGIDLADIPDLKYTQENTPYVADRLIATIERVGETEPIEVYQMSELDASLKAGDVVTLHRTITESIIVDSNIKDSVVFKDTAKTVLTPGTYKEGDLVRIAAPTYLDFSAGNIIAVYNKNYRSSDGKGTVSTALSASVASDISITTSSGSTALYNKVDYRYILINDYEWNIGASIDMNGDSATIDMNGHKLTLNFAVAGKRTFNVGDGNGRVTFCNGDLTMINGGTDLSMVNGTSMFSFVNIGELVFGGSTPTYFDQRGGLVHFEDIEDAHYIGYAYADGKRFCCPTVVSSKSSGTTRSSVIIDNAKFDLAKARTLQYLPEGCTTLADYDTAPFLINNVSAGGDRQGSMHGFFKVVNGSEIKLEMENFLEITAHANSTGALTYAEDGTTVTGWTQSAAYAKNENQVKLDIHDSLISTGNNSAVVVEIYTFYADSDHKYMPAEQFSFDVDIDVKNSAVHSSYLINHTRAKDVPAALDYTYDVDVNVDATSKLAYTNALTHNQCADPLNFNLAEGVKLGKKALKANDEQADVNCVLPEGAVIAYSSLDEDCDCVVTSSTETYTYKLGQQDEVEFYWNLPAEGTDEVNIDRVVTLESEAGLYTYSWVQNEKAFTTKLDKAFALSAKSNLTLYDYIYFNLYVNKDQLDAIAEHVNLNRDNAELVQIDGVSYYKFQVKDIDPTKIDEDVMSVSVSFTTVYGDECSYTNNFSVLTYAGKILENENTTDASAELIRAMLNYLGAAADYLTDSTTAGKINALIPGYEAAAMPTEGGKLESLANASINVKYGSTLYLGVQVEAGDEVTISYKTWDGSDVTAVATADEDGEAYFAIKAYDFASDITVTYAGNSATINLIGYYNALVESSETAAAEMAAAIYNYAVAAKAYKPVIGA